MPQAEVNLEILNVGFGGKAYQKTAYIGRGDQRNLYETKIKNGSIVVIADSEWLNCDEKEYETNAHNYFQEKQSSNPLMGVVVMGFVELSLYSINA